MAPLVPTGAAERALELAHAYEATIRAKRIRTILFLAVVLASASLAGWIVDVDLAKLLRHIGGFFGYFDRILTLDTGQRVWTDFSEWFWGLRKWLLLLGDTLLMAYLGTLLGAAIGFLVCFPASANLMPNGWIRFGAKRLLEFCRTVPEIVFALVFVIAFGLGPVPGVLAIAIHTAGALGKLFSEAVENIDMRPVQGAVSTGASWPATVRFAVLPQVASNFASYALLRFEINVRGASVLGFVGAGGIGQDLIESIRKFYYSDVSAILVLLLLTVSIIDIATERARHRLIGIEERR